MFGHRSSVTACMAFKIVGKVLLKINSHPPLMTFRAGSGRKKPLLSRQTVQRLLKRQYPALSLIGKQNTLFFVGKAKSFLVLRIILCLIVTGFFRACVSGSRCLFRVWVKRDISVYFIKNTGLDTDADQSQPKFGSVTRFFLLLKCHF